VAHIHHNTATEINSLGMNKFSLLPGTEWKIMGGNGYITIFFQI
jgi:hypothetical protein